MTTMRGISPKIWPALQLALGAVIADWGADGTVSRGSLAGLALAAIAVAFAYLAPVGDVELAQVDGDGHVTPTLAE